MTQIHKQNPIQDKQIAIIGAGPGGLTLARLLQMHGAKVKVFERYQSVCPSAGYHLEFE